MVEALIESTLDALLEPANRRNGITDALLKFMKPAFDSDAEYKAVVADPSSEESEELVYDRLEDYLTGEPDRIEALEDILDRQDGLDVADEDDEEYDDYSDSDEEEEDDDDF